MTERTLVEFSGSRGGICALSWGQVAIWRAVQRMVPDDAALNDRRFDAQTPVAAGEAVTAAAIEALLPATRLRRERVEHYGARYFLHVNAVPGSLDLTLFADSSVLPVAAVEAHLRGIEALLVEAATTTGAENPVTV